MTPLSIRTCFLRPPPHHCFIRVFQQEADGHEGKAFLGVSVDRNPPGVTLVHIRPADTQHPGDAGSTKVNVQDANLEVTSVTCSRVYIYIQPNCRFICSFLKMMTNIWKHLNSKCSATCSPSCRHA